MYFSYKQTPTITYLTSVMPAGYLLANSSSSYPKKTFPPTISKCAQFPTEEELSHILVQIR